MLGLVEIHFNSRKFMLSAGFYSIFDSLLPLFHSVGPRYSYLFGAPKSIERMSFSIA